MLPHQNPDPETLDPTLPHEFLERFLLDSIGRRAKFFDGEFIEDIFRPLVLGLSDQLSVYTYLNHRANLRLGEVSFKLRPGRTHLLIPIQDRGCPLRLRSVFLNWDVEIKSNRISDLILGINGRRWNFIDNQRGFIHKLILTLADRIDHYYQLRPYARLEADLFRFVEGVDKTYMDIELDVREDPRMKDLFPERYRI